MRDIKFRAWNKYHKKMYEVYSIDYRYGMVYCHEPTGNTDHTFGMIDIILEQFIDLKDRIGKEVCEGDIDKTFGNIILAYGCFVCRSIVCNEDGEEEENDTIYGYTSQTQREIIGNIHELKEPPCDNSK